MHSLAAPCCFCTCFMPTFGFSQEMGIAFQIQMSVPRSVHQTFISTRSTVLGFRIWMLGSPHAVFSLWKRKPATVGFPYSPKQSISSTRTFPFAFVSALTPTWHVDRAHAGGKLILILCLYLTIATPPKSSLNESSRNCHAVVDGSEWLPLSIVVRRAFSVAARLPFIFGTW